MLFVLCDRQPGCTPLYAAASNGHLEVVKLLSENGGDIHSVVPEDEATALHIAGIYVKFLGNF
jgi:ankyrin repeat protein